MHVIKISGTLISKDLILAYQIDFCSKLIADLIVVSAMASCCLLNAVIWHGYLEQ